MSQISKSQIQHVAELAKIEVGGQESEALSAKLSDILDMVEKMQSVDTENVEALAHAVHHNQKLRADQSTAIEDRDRYQALSEKTDDGFYLVPKVID